LRAQTFFAVAVFAAGCLSAQGSGGRNKPEQIDKPYVVLVSFDGFANEYLDRFKLPNFGRAIRNGVRADSLVSVFPSATFPAHYSIVTGLYPEHHGIVSMSFYDPSRKEDVRLPVAYRRGREVVPRRTAVGYRREAGHGFSFLLLGGIGSSHRGCAPDLLEKVLGAVEE
jgi:predicted AlkP superfamily pyrophosphatase or phosphodiesterase